MIQVKTKITELLSDVYTPVGIYLRLRDQFRDTILLESTDNNAANNSWSFIGVNAIAGIEFTKHGELEIKLPNQPAQKKVLANQNLTDVVNGFLKNFNFEKTDKKESKFAQGVFGYTAFDAVQYFDKIPQGKFNKDTDGIPLVRYRLYQYVIAINHFKDAMYICENEMEGLESKLSALLSYIKGKDVPVFPFSTHGDESSNMTDEDYRNMVLQGIAHCKRGDVFQVVLSRRFSQPFKGDEFNVYRTLRSINPSPYLFYFDYGDYKIFGSSPESQLIIENGKAIVHPIAGTVKRTGDDAVDAKEAIRLENDAKENAEHVMLVDLARNDLSRGCTHVYVKKFRETHYYSHVIHLVSEVSGTVKKDMESYTMFAKSFPAGTLSGAPKIRAMEIITQLEPTDRGYYGGAVGFMGADGSCNQAIMIRTFLSSKNHLHCQAGAGIVILSQPESELQEVNNKLGALKKAIVEAEKMSER